MLFKVSFPCSSTYFQCTIALYWWAIYYNSRMIVNTFMLLLYKSIMWSLCNSTWETAIYRWSSFTACVLHMSLQFMFVLFPKLHRENPWSGWSSDYGVYVYWFPVWQDHSISINSILSIEIIITNIVCHNQ